MTISLMTMETNTGKNKNSVEKGAKKVSKPFKP